MREDRISRTQLMALLWAGAMAPAAELLPGVLLPEAGEGSWLAVALAAPLVLAAGWLLGRLSGERGLAGGIRSALGPWLGTGVLMLYALWALLLLALRLRMGAQRMLASAGREEMLWFFLLTAAAMLLWIGGGPAAAFARAGQLFLTVLLATAGVVLVLSLFQVEPERLFPVREVPRLLRGSVKSAGVVGWGLFAAFLTGRTRGQGERKSWHWAFWGLGGMALLAAAQAVIIGDLGAGLAARLEDPFFALAKSVGVEGAFQRVESLVAALWTFADLAMCGLLIFAIREIWGEVFRRGETGRVGQAAVLLAAAAALFLLRDRERARYLSGTVAPAGNLLLGVGVPIFVQTAKSLRRISKNRGTSCGEK